MADQATRSANRSGATRPRGTERSGPTPTGTQGDHVCPVAFCPVGMALSAANRLSPEVLEHLMVAARELFLAVRAVVDARASDFGEREERSGLERIEIA